MRSLKRINLALVLAILFSAPAYGLTWIEKNDGQAPSEYNFVAHTADLTALVANTHVDLLLGQDQIMSTEVDEDSLNEADKLETNAKQEVQRIRLELVGSNSESKVGEAKTARGVTHYFRGSNKDSWITDVPQFSEVEFQDVYPGIDVIYRLTSGQLEYDFIVSPGADASVIRLGLTGATDSKLSNDHWTSRTSVGNVVQSIPTIYQFSKEGSREVLSGVFQANTDGTIGFEVTGHDESQTLVIDPIIEFSGRFGGNRMDAAYSMKTAQNGNYVISGVTNSLFETIEHPSELIVNNEIFVAEIDSETGEPQWITVLGGAQRDVSETMDVDSAGNIVLVGRTESADFPTANAFQSVFAGNSDGGFGVTNSDGFITKLAADGSSLVFSTFVGGADNASNVPGNFGYELLRGLDFDAQDNIYVAGQTSATDFPVTNTFNDTGCFELDSDPNNPLQGSFVTDVIVAKFSASGDRLFSACIGGSNRDSGRDIKVQDDGTVHVAGFSRSDNFPTSVNALQSQPLSDIAFSPLVLKLSADLTNVEWSTLVGEGVLQQIDSDSSGNVYGVVFSFLGLNSATPGAFQTESSDDSNSGFAGEGYIFKLNAEGTDLEYGTYLGGLGEDSLSSILVDEQGRAIVSGETVSPFYPLKNAIVSVPEPALSNFSVGFSSDSNNSLSRTLLQIGNSLETRLSLISRNGVNRAALGDSDSFGQVVVFSPFVPQYNTAAMEYVEDIVTDSDSGFVLAANRNGVNQLFEYDPVNVNFDFVTNVGDEKADSRAVLKRPPIPPVSGTGDIGFFVANYGQANSLFQFSGSQPATVTEVSVGRDDGNTTALAEIGIRQSGFTKFFVAVANEFQDIRLVSSASDDAIVLDHPVGAVSDLVAGNINGGTFSQELVIASKDRPVEVLFFDEFNNISNAVTLTETGTGNLSVVLSDINSDGFSDLVVGRTEQDMLFVNDGLGNFVRDASYTGSAEPTKALVNAFPSSNPTCPCFSVTDEQVQQITESRQDIVVSVLNPTGTDLEFSTRITGNGQDSSFRGLKFAPGSDSKLLLAGSSTGDQWPSANSVSESNGGEDAVYLVLELDQDGDNALDGNDNCLLVENPNQRDSNDDGFGNVCDADLNNDNIVNFIDVFLFTNVFQSSDADADFDGDGAVTFLDFALLRDSFLQPPGPGINDIN